MVMGWWKKSSGRKRWSDRMGGAMGDLPAAPGELATQVYDVSWMLYHAGIARLSYTFSICR